MILLDGKLLFTTGLKVTFAPDELVATLAISAGQTRSSVGGGCSGVTLTLKLQVSVGPAVEVAVQVTRVLPTEKVEPEVGAHVVVMLLSGRSLNTVVVKLTTVPDELVASRVMSNGHTRSRCEEAGAVTFTLKLQVSVGPAVEVEEQFTTVLPTENTEPLAGVHVVVRELAGRLPKVVVTKLTATPVVSAAWRVMSSGQTRSSLQTSTKPSLSVSVGLLQALVRAQ